MNLSWTHSSHRLLPQNPNATHPTPQASQLYLSQRYEESLQAFSEALLLAPDGWHERPKLHCNRAAALIMLHRYEEAVRDCEQAVAQDPALLKAYTREGRAYLHMGVLDKAAVAPALVTLFDFGWFFSLAVAGTYYYLTAKKK